MKHTVTQFMPNSLQQKCYVFFTYKGKKHRLYDGTSLDLLCYPNKEKTVAGRQRELNRLQEATAAALKGGWFPGQEKKLVIPVKAVKPATPAKPVRATAIRAIMEQQEQFDRQFWSVHYIRDMNRVANELIVYLRSNGLSELPLKGITVRMLSKFLDGYRSSGRYYMNKRRNLSALFARFVVAEDLTANPVPRTPAVKTKETLNEAFTPDQLTEVLAHLKAHHPNLHLCAIMTYGTLLRPHREIRLLQRKNFDATLDYILLAGGATKSGRIRRVPVPDYVKEQLIRRGVQDMAPDTFIFTSTATPVNADYFTTAWSRQKRLMLDERKILPSQTLYSFRHSAAVFSFTNKQNLRLLQELMGHSTPDVTTKYLRSLGAIQVSLDDMPRLPGG